jgi:hypothetical protein
MRNNQTGILAVVAAAILAAARQRGATISDWYLNDSDYDVYAEISRSLCGDATMKICGASIHRSASAPELRLDSGGPMVRGRPQSPWLTADLENKLLPKDAFRIQDIDRGPPAFETDYVAKVLWSALAASSCHNCIQRVRGAKSLWLREAAPWPAPPKRVQPTATR